MTETQILVLIGTIWVAPHINKLHGLMTGMFIFIIASCKGLGLV